MVAVAFDANFEVVKLWPTLAQNATWGAIGVVVFGVCSAAVAIAFRAIAIRRDGLAA